MLRIGSVSLDVPFFQAPLSGYSDYAMRRLARQFGCPLTFTGVMLAKSMVIPKVLAQEHFRPHDDEHPVGAQILGEEPSVMAKAAKALHQAGYDIIDLNFACPAPKVIQRGRGGALLDEPDRAIEIFRAVRDTVDCPVTVKLRPGINSSAQSREKFWNIVNYVLKNGADAIAVHGRYVLKRFSGKTDNGILKELKQKYPEKVIIGSGDLFTVQDAVRLLEDTGVDGFCIARGAIGNPWIFSELRTFFNGKKRPDEPTLQQQRKIIVEHFEQVCSLYPLKKAIPYFRKFLVGYCKRHPQRKKPQMAFLAAKSKEQLLSSIDRWYEF